MSGKVIAEFVGVVNAYEGTSNVRIVEGEIDGLIAFIESFVVEEDETGYYWSSPTEEEAMEDFYEQKKLFEESDLDCFNLYVYHNWEGCQVKDYDIEKKTLKTYSTFYPDECGSEEIARAEGRGQNCPLIQKCF